MGAHHPNPPPPHSHTTLIGLPPTHTYASTGWRHLMRHKTITLCLNSFEIATKKPNFSAWVRMKLLDESLEMKEMDINSYQYQYECPRCHKEKVFPSQDMAWRCNMCDVALDFVSVSV